jgi:hypothetical protein
MKYKLRAKVEGDLFLARANSTIAAQRENLTFELESDDRQRIIAISVCRPVPPEKASAHRAVIMHTPDAQAKSHIEFHADKELHVQLVRELQGIESILAFNWRGHPLKRIRWSESEMSLLPETPDEEARVQLWSMSVGRSVPKTPQLVKEESFKTLVLCAPWYDRLTVSVGFWREAGNQMEAGNYVQAFCNYFFVVEDLYADGKTAERQVLRAFADSAEFCEICTSTLPRFFGRGDTHELALRRFFEAEGCEPNVPGLQKFLFRMRGNMHHYFGKSPRPHPTPFNQDEFHAVALVALYISTVALSRQVLALNKKHGPAKPID